MGDGSVSFDGGDTEVFAQCTFVRLPSPGVHKPLQVRYWFNPTSTIDNTPISFSHVQTESQTAGFTDDADLYNPMSLVVVQNLQPKRVWNPADGDISLNFDETLNSGVASSTQAVHPFCAGRGICDFESGICNCFSGYTGLRCEQQNAVTYAY